MPEETRKCVFQFNWSPGCVLSTWDLSIFNQILYHESYCEEWRLWLDENSSNEEEGNSSLSLLDVTKALQEREDRQ